MLTAAMAVAEPATKRRRVISLRMLFLPKMVTFGLPPVGDELTGDLGNPLRRDLPEILVLHVDDGVIAAYRRLEQRMIVGGRSRGDDDEAGDMRIPGLERLRMLRRRGAPHPRRLAHDERDAALAAEHIARLGRLVD